MSKRRTSFALWALSGLLAITFVMTGFSKVVPIPPSGENFARWGLSPMFRIAIGVLEMLGGIALLVPRLAMLAALGLIGIMLGALRTGVVFHETMHIVLPAVLIVLLAVVAYARRKALLGKR